jgi:hypothetical protein
MTSKQALFALATLGIAAALPASAGRAANKPAKVPALLARYVAAFNNHDVAAFKDVIAENYVQHNGRSGQGLTGLQGTVQQYFQTFTDFHVQLEDSVVAGNKVVARVTFTATHDHPGRARRSSRRPARS